MCPLFPFPRLSVCLCLSPATASIILGNGERWWTTNKRRAAKRWAMTLVVGMATGLIAVFVTFCTKSLFLLKIRLVHGQHVFARNVSALGGWPSGIDSNREKIETCVWSVR